MKSIFRTSKKALSLFMAIMMVVTAWVFVVPASAVDIADSAVCPNNEDHTMTAVNTVKPTCTDVGYTVYKCDELDCGAVVNADKTEAKGHSFTIKNTIAPTCTQQGYTIEICDACGIAIRDNFKKPNGHNYVNPVELPANCTKEGGYEKTCSVCGDVAFFKEEVANGHEWNEEYMIVKHPVLENTYAMARTCSNVDKRIVCDHENGICYNYNIDTCRCAEAGGCMHLCQDLLYMTATGTTENPEDPSIKKFYKVTFVNTWATAEYKAASDKTMVPASYKTDILDTVYVEEGKAAEFNDANPLRDTDENAVYTFESWDKDLSNITEETVVKAQFAADTEATHIVTFYNYNAGIVLGTQVVKHGQSAIMPNIYPTRDRNGYMNFEFREWDHSEAQLAHVYADKAVVAQYNHVPAKYKVVYHDWDGFELGSEVVGYSESAMNAPRNLERQRDNYNVYSFSGYWRLEDGSLVDMDSFYLTDARYAKVEYSPENEANKEMSDVQKGIVHVYADYYNKLLEYKTRIVVLDSEGDPVSGATIQVITSNGNLFTTFVTDENYEAILSLPYDPEYTLQITCNGEVTSQKLILTDKYLQTNYPSHYVQLQRPDDYYGEGITRCNCVSHVPVLGRLYITFLNIIYSLTGRKVVCCEDMYATHGKQLAYGPDR